MNRCLPACRSRRWWNRFRTVVVLLVVGTGLVKVGHANALGDQRLFFTAQERQTLEQAESVQGQEAATSESALSDHAAAAPAANTVRKPARVLPEPVSSRHIIYTGQLRSDQGQTYLINGLPWQPGWLGIQTIRPDREANTIALSFADGTARVLAIGQSVELNIP